MRDESASEDSEGDEAVGAFWNAGESTGVAPSLVEAGMAIDALLDARNDQTSSALIGAIDALLARMSGRRVLTADEAIVVVYQLDAVEKQHARTGAVVPVFRRTRRRLGAI